MKIGSGALDPVRAVTKVVGAVDKIPGLFLKVFFRFIPSGARIFRACAESPVFITLELNGRWRIRLKRRGPASGYLQQ